MIAQAYRKTRQLTALTLVFLLCLGSATAGITITGADGITATGADGVNYVSTSGITATGADGFLTFAANGITATGADGITATGADGITITGADSFVETKADGITATGADAAGQSGIRSVDPELAVRLNNLTDDSNVDAIIVYHQKPTDADLTDLITIGVLGGTKYRELPMIALTASKRQIPQISHLSSVRSIYGNLTLQSTLDPYLAMTGTDRVRRDADLT